MPKGLEMEFGSEAKAPCLVLLLCQLGLIGIMGLLPLERAWALVGGGGYVPFAGKMQTSKDGKDNKYSLNPMIMVHAPFHLGGQHDFIPHLGLVLHTGTGDDYTKRTIFFLFHLAWNFTSSLALNYGLGTFLTSIEGKGEAVMLNNGSGYSTFYRPGESQISYNTTLDLGLEYHLMKNYSLALDTFLFSFLSSSKRSLSYALSLNYYL